jgi:hypothetical protein
MLKRLHVEGFKSLVNVEVEFPALTVLFGPNAVGKSNLLDALLVLSRLATERTLADALSGPVRGYFVECFTFPEGGHSLKIMKSEPPLPASRRVDGLKDSFSEGLWMADLVRVDLFVEDRAQEAFVGALVRRVLREASREAIIHSRSALGGHGRALTELEAFQKAVRGRQPGLNVPDIRPLLNQTTSDWYTFHSPLVGAHSCTPLQRRVPACLGLHFHKCDCANLVCFDLGTQIVLPSVRYARRLLIVLIRMCSQG